MGQSMWEAVVTSQNPPGMVPAHGRSWAVMVFLWLCPSTIKITFGKRSSRFSRALPS